MFNPDQPRDKDGKFGEGGGAGADKEHPKVAAAKAKHAEAVKEHEHAKNLLAISLKPENGATAEGKEQAKVAAFKAGKKAAAAKFAAKKVAELHIGAAPNEPALSPKAEAAPPPPPPPAATAKPPQLSKAEAKHEALTAAYAKAKEALAAAIKSGDASAEMAAKQGYLKAGKAVAAAKHAVKKLSGNHQPAPKAAPPAKAAPPPPKVEPPKAPAPHLEHGATVKIEGGKSEHGGVLAGTVVGWSKEPGMTAVLQLGKTEAQWHENSKLSGHNVISAWAKQQETVGKDVAKAMFPSASHDPSKAVELKALVNAVAKSAADKASKEVEAAKNNPDLVIKDAHKWGIVHFKQWEQSLTPQEHGAVKGYTNSEYSQINGYLRFGQNADKGVIAKVEAIQTALLKSPGLPHAMVLKRGMGGTFPIAPGDTYEDKGFMSTSVGGGHFQRQNILHITAQAGAKGAFMTMSTHTTETEFLLPHGSKMKVTKVETKGAVRHIHGELLPHGHQDTGDETPLEFPDSGVDLSNSDKLNGEAEDIIIYRDGEIIHNGPEMRRRGGSGY